MGKSHTEFGDSSIKKNSEMLPGRRLLGISGWTHFILFVAWVAIWDFGSAGRRSCWTLPNDQTMGSSKQPIRMPEYYAAR